MMITDVSSVGRKGKHARDGGSQALGVMVE